MKRIFLLGMLVLMPRIGMSETSVNATSYRPIVVRPTHPEFNVTLHAGDEAGFQWFVKDYNPKIVRLIRMQTIPSSSPNLKSVVWQFRVVPEAFKVQHLTTIELVYAKPWDIRNAKYYSFPVITQVSNSVGSDLRL